MATPIVVMLEHPITHIGDLGFGNKSRASRIIIFDVDEETGAKSVRDIMEATNDYLVVRNLLVPFLDYHIGQIFLARVDQEPLEIVLKSKDPRNQTIQLLGKLEPH